MTLSIQRQQENMNLALRLLIDAVGRGHWALRTYDP